MIRLIYYTLRYTVLSLIFLISILIFSLEKPSIVYGIIKKPLNSIGISIDNIDGSPFYGLDIRGINYQNRIKLDRFKLKVDWKLLNKKILQIDDIRVENLYIEEQFLNSLLESNGTDSSDSNLSIPIDINKIIIKRGEFSLKKGKYRDGEIGGFNLGFRDLNIDIDINSSTLIKETKIGEFNLTANRVLFRDFKVNLADIYLKDLDIKGYLDTILLSRADININRGRYREYIIDYGELKLADTESNLKDYKTNLSLKLKSSIANGDIKGRLNNSYIDIRGDITPKSLYLSRFLKGSNITLKRDAVVNIGKLRGDYKKSLDFDIKLNNLSATFNRYSLSTKKFLASGNYSIEKNSLNLKLDTILNSNIGKVSLVGDSFINFNDINNTLKYNIRSKLNIKRVFLSKYLEGIYLKRLSSIYLKLNGDLKKTNFKLNTPLVAIKKGDISLKSPISLRGNGSILNGDIEFRLYIKPDSNIGRGVIGSVGLFNFKRFKSTFNHKTNLNITLNRSYLNRFLYEHNITLVKSPNIKGVVGGDLNNIDTALNTKLKFLYQKSILNLALNIPNLNFNIETSDIKGKVKSKVTSPNIAILLNSKFSGNIKDIEGITSNSYIEIDRFNGFGVNLKPLLPLKIALSSKNRLLDFKLNSDRLNIYGESKDFDEVSLKIRSKKLYLYKMVSLPPELEHKYIMLDLNLNTKLSTKYIDLNGYIYSNKKFKAYIKLLNSRSKKFSARLNSEHLTLLAKGDLESRNIIATLNIDSIEELQKEIAKVYNFKIANIDGSLKSKLILHRDSGSFKIISPKLELNGFNIEDIAFDAKYKNRLITLNRVTWRVTGFSDKKFNKKFYLKRKGKIYLGDRRYIDIQIYPNISIEAKEGEDGLNGRLKMVKVPVAHPDYGSAFLSCNILYNEQSNQREITGDVNIKYMQIFYEAKFLEADYDPDIVVVSRKRKRIREKLENNDFFKNTKIDISLKAYQTNYRTPNIDLTFDINLNIYKEFGKNITILGKVEDINGHFDQTPKRFLVKNSNIVFQGGEEINPLLDIRVEYELPQVLIEIYIGGYANRPKIEFSSEPPMPKKDIMSYLLFGTSTKKLTDGEGSLSREAELFILNQLARDFAYEFKLDRLFIKDDGTGEGYAVEVGKRVGKRNMVIIESSKAGNSYIIERDISKHLKLRVGEHIKEHQSQSIDIFFRKKFK